MQAADPIAARRLKRLRVAIVALLAVVILLGMLSAYLLRSLNRDYSALIDRSVPVLNELRVLTGETLSTQRALLASLAALDDDARQRSLAYMQTQMDGGRLVRLGIVKREVFAAAPRLIGDLDHAGSLYEAQAAQFIDLMKEGRVNDAQKLRSNTIKDTIKDYLDRIETAAKFVEGHSQQARDGYSVTAQSHSLFLLSLAGLPLVFVVVTGVVVVAFAAFAILVFCWSGSDNDSSA